jgi:hypothetical protein
MIATTVIQMFAFSNSWQTIIGLLVIALLFPWAGCLDYYQRRRAGTAVVATAKKIKSSLPTTPAAA